MTLPGPTTVPFTTLGAYHLSVEVEPTKGFVAAKGPLSAQKFCCWLTRLTDVLVPNDAYENEGGAGVPPPIKLKETEIKYWW